MDKGDRPVESGCELGFAGLLVYMEVKKRTRMGISVYWVFNVGYNVRGC